MNKNLKNYIYNCNLNSDAKIVVFDDIFPHLLSAFRIAEFNYYLEEFKNCKVYTDPTAFKCINEKRSFEEVRTDYAKYYPNYEKRIQLFNDEEEYFADLAYMIFLNNAYRFIEIIDKYSIPFLFTLYPGGGFELNGKYSDEKLRRVCNSPNLEKIIVTQSATRNYLKEYKFIEENKIKFIYGGVLPTNILNRQRIKKRHYKSEKYTFDICFVANKYMAKGSDKGYDKFVEVAKKLSKEIIDVHFHVVGNFDKNDINVYEINDRITFYGTRNSSFFPEFYSNMDIILSPNIPFVLSKGAFDGFPTGCCIEAGLCGVAVFCSDYLRLNDAFKESEEIEILENDLDSITTIIKRYYNNFEKLYELARNGQKKFISIFSLDHQMLPRTKILTEILNETLHKKEKPLVSILCITYNHANYIKQALDGFLMQRTNFEFEIIIADDASTDSNQKIIKEYYNIYPQIIYPILREQNLGPVKNWLEAYKKCKGKYIALCEGDDFWTDPNKLQKQINFFEDNPGTVICCNKTLALCEDVSKNYIIPPPEYQRSIMTIDDLIKLNFIATCSVMFKNNLIEKLPEWYTHLKLGDYPLHLINAQYGTIGYIDEIMSTYRIHSDSYFSSNNAITNYKAIIEMYVFVNEYFNYKYDIQIRGMIDYYYTLIKEHYMSESDQKKINKSADNYSSPELFTQLNLNASENKKCEEFEVNNWLISEFIITKLVPIVSYKPFPLNELILMVGAVIRIRPNHIFEWGTNIGVSARIFYETIKYFNINCEIHTVDLPDDVDHVEHPGQNRGKLIKGLNSIHMYLGDGILRSMEIIKNTAGNRRLLFFLDGDHSYQSVFRELSIIDSQIEYPNILLHDTFYQSSGSNYNVGPFKAIQDLISNSKNEYKVINVNTGLPGMTLLYHSESEKDESSIIKNDDEIEKIVKINKSFAINVQNFNNAKPLNILHTVEFYNPHIGGAELVVQELSERLVKRGHSVAVATSKNKERNLKELNGVNIIEFDIQGSLGRGVQGNDIAKYQDFITYYPADVMMNYAAQQWATDIVFSRIDKVYNNKVNIIAPCGYSALQDSKTIRWVEYFKYFDEFIPKVIPVYDAAIYHSSMYQDYEFALNHGFKNSVIIPNGVGEDEFEKNHTINFREKYGIRNKFMGLCVANYYKSKGHEVIIDSLKKLKRNDFTVVFIGNDGGELTKLKVMAKDLDAVFLQKIAREDTVAAFHQADLFLFGSQIEAFPLVILESKASKTPFISTNCGNVKELKGGIVCKTNEIAGNIDKLLDNESLRKRLAFEGYTEWKEKYTWESVTDKYEELYLRLFYEKFNEGVETRIDHLQNQIEKEYTNINYYLQSAKILINSNKKDKAVKYLEDALEIDFENKEANFLLDLILAEQ